MFKRTLLLTTLSIFTLGSAMAAAPQSQNSDSYASWSASSDVTLFSTSTARSQMDLPEDLVKFEVLDLDINALSELMSQRNAELRLSLPDLNGGTQDLVLQQVSLVADDFMIKEMPSGKVHSTELSGIHYRGHVDNVESSIVSFSLFEDEVMGMISRSDRASNQILGLTEDKEAYLLYNDGDIAEHFDFECGTNTDDFDADKVDMESHSETKMTTRCPEIFFDIGRDIYQNKGSVSGASNYITALFNQVATLYDNDGMNIVLSGFNVWTSQEPFDDLGPYRSYRNSNSFNGDLAHYVNLYFGGGVAYLDGLCNSFKYGVSGINSFYSNVPSYSWSVNVVAHELGHNMGSPHTHDCAWNGNNTALDGCGTNAGYSGCSGSNPSNGGTIMSYCHLIWTSGINFNLGFGSQPTALMQNNIDGSNCIANCAAACNYVNINFNDFENNMGIWKDGGSDCRRDLGDDLYANSGSYCVRLRNGSASSHFRTPSANGNPYEEVTVEFSFITSGVSSGDSFVLELSTNNGSSYSVEEEWIEGTHFNEGSRYNETVVINGPFSNSTRLRFRTDGNNANDRYYFDDVRIQGCRTASAAPQDDEGFFKGSAQTYALGVKSLELYPNPASDIVSLDLDESIVGVGMIRILDLSGKLVLEYTLNSGERLVQLDTSSLPIGIYQLTIMDDVGSNSLPLSIVR